MPPAPQLLTSRQVCAAAGITYRQLDWLIRSDVVCPTCVYPRAMPGSGMHRRWPADIARRLWVAARFTADRSTAFNSSFTQLAALALEGLEPPESGWALYDGQRIEYAPDPVLVAEALVNGPDRPLCVSILPLDACPPREQREDA